MRERKQQLSTILFTRETTGDCYVGTAQQLIDNGTITLDQLPGMPGMPKTSASFVDGLLQPSNSRPVHDTRWMRVSLYGNKVHVTCGISDEERAQRMQRALDEAEAKRKAAGVPDIGYDGAVRMFSEASAAFQPGDIVMVDGKAATVVSGHRLQSVTSANGRYVRPYGERVNYQPGYVCRTVDGEQFFWPAHEVRTAGGNRGHIRLVHSRAQIVADQPTTPKVESAASWPFATVHGSPP